MQDDVEMVASELIDFFAGRVMIEQNADCELLKWCIAVLDTVMRRCSDEEIPLVVRIVAVEAVVRALVANPARAELQTFGLDALAAAAAHPKIRHEVVAWGGIGVILRSLVQHASSAEIHAHGLHTLAWLVHEESAQQSVVYNRGLAVLMNSMRCHILETEVALHGCRILASMSVTKGLESSLFDAGAVETGHEVVRRYGNQENMAELVLKMIGNLATDMPIAAKIALDAKNGLTVVVNTMDAFVVTTNVQIFGCAALANLCSVSDSQRQRLAELGGLFSIVRAMREHPHSPELQYEGAKALMMCCWTAKPEILRRILECGGVGAVRAALSVQPRHPQMATLGPIALAKVEAAERLRTSVRRDDGRRTPDGAGAGEPPPRKYTGM